MSHRSSKQSNAHSQRGQGLVEYVIILSLVALAVVLIIRVLEPAIANVFSQFVNDAPVAPPSLLSYTPPPVTPTPSATATLAPGETPPTPTATPIQSPTPTPSNTPTNTPTSTSTATATNTPTITPTPIPQVLFVVGNTTLSTGDSIIRTQLNALAVGRGYTVQTIDDNVAQTADATGRSLIVISSSVSDATVNTKFRTVAVPVVLWEDSLLDDMGMVGTTGNPSGTANNQTSVVIVDSTHALAGNLSGTQIVYSGTNGQAMTWGAPNSNAARIATLTNNSSRYPIFGYTSGAVMPGLTAPARRVGFFLTNDGPQVLTSAGLTLFNSAINWAMN